MRKKNKQLLGDLKETEDTEIWWGGTRAHLGRAYDPVARQTTELI
jgi:hypothetical protein